MPSWISNQNNFSYFWSASHPDTSYQVSRNGILVQEKFKIDFQDGGMSLVTFDLQVTLILPTKF